MNIQEILKLHKEYLETNGSNGTKANLSWADLRGANLSEADLSWADLQVGNFRRWQYFATSEHLRIGCESYDWAKWKKSGAAIAKMHNCSDEFKAFWPVLEATRKNLVKRFSKKKGE